MKNILILCTGNSARSILAESLLNELGRGRVKAYSAGSKPRGDVHPASIRLLQAKGFDTALLRSKSWDEFAAAGAPKLDIVITVCDSAAGESCPIWPGAPVTAHWGIEDPAHVSPDEEDAAIAKAFDLLKGRVEAMLDLDLDGMPPSELKAALNRIGAESEGATELAASHGTPA